MNTLKRIRTKPDNHVLVTWLLIAGLFFLRIPLMLWATMLQKLARAWASPLMEIGTYTLTALLVLWERKRLADFHIDRLALWFLILGKPLEILLGYLHLVPTNLYWNGYYLLYLPIALGLGIAMLATHPPMPIFGKGSWRWIVFSILGGLFLAVVSSLLLRTPRPAGKLFVLPSLPVIVFLPLQQMFYAGITEEPFFRGFLWGSLRKAGWKEVWIWLFQALLFQLAHLYYVNTLPFSFWILIPLGGLVLGFVAWRSRSIGNSILAHGIGNGIGQILDFYL